MCIDKVYFWCYINCGESMKTIKRDEVLEYINDYIVKNRIADSYEDLKLFCQVEGINTTKEQIKTFLRNKAKEDGVDMRVLQAPFAPIDLVNTNENLIKRSTDKFIQEIKASKYIYHREDLQYFNDLFRIYTLKCLKICAIISMIAGRRMIDNDKIQKLDITINSKEVLLSDIDRLLVPLVHNYTLALDVKLNAEQMNTYLDLNVNMYGIDKNGIHYNECLPSRDLQDYNGCQDKKQFIALTDKQKKAYEDHLIENFSHYIEENIDN